MNLFRWKLAQLFENWWWRHYLYNKNYQTYLQDKIDYWNRFLAWMEIPLPEGKVILDAGCGPAGIFCAMPISNKIVGVDPLMEQYQSAFKALIQSKGNVSFVKSELEHYHNPQAFDMVFCLNVINHVQDIEASLLQLKLNAKQLAPIVISSEVHTSRVWAKIMKIASWLDVLHPYQMTQEEFEQLFVRLGFNLEKSIQIKKGKIFHYHAWILYNN